MAAKKTGGCLCGAVHYEVNGSLRDVVACHCSQCRKQTGHFYAATNAALADISIEGHENLTHFRASDGATRQFCKHCGSALFWHRDDSDTISILAGSFDTLDEVQLTRHIFCADKGAYYQIDDGLPQFAAAD